MSAGNPDIRQQVDDNRGALKKLQLLVPGLSGYRRREDVRVADELLRNQVADKLDMAKSNLEDLRKQMVNAGDFTNLTAVGSLISQVQQFGGEVRHAQQGYSGFAATISVDEAKLNKLYDYDYDFVAAGMQVVDSTSPSKLIYDPAAPNSIQTPLSGITRNLTDLKQKWAVRIEAIENIMVS